MRFQHLQEWLDWQTTLHPKGIELGLDRARAVWDRLGLDLSGTTVITVGGTNGKGSSVALLETILRAAGHRVGCYTSPHLLRYNERIRCDGIEATDRRICLAFDLVERARGDTALTYFEFGTLAALAIFAEQRPDVVVLEVGLGGRLDAVNIIAPDCALISTIDLDHQEWLGNTRGKIAREKAGILRAGRPAVFAGLDAPPELLEAADALGTPLRIAGRDFGFERAGERWNWWGVMATEELPRRAGCARQPSPDSAADHPSGTARPTEGEGDRSTQVGAARLDGLPLPNLTGGFQVHNAAAVMQVLHLLAPRLAITREAVEQGLKRVTVPGRFQWLGGSPEVILDVAHNPEAARALADNLRAHRTAGRTLAVFAMLGDKAVEEVVASLAGEIDHWYLGGLEGERTLPIEQLCQRVTAAGIPPDRITVSPTIRDALVRAHAQALPGDRIIGFGSFLTVAGLLQILSRSAVAGMVP